MAYTAQTFSIPALDGISEESIKQHIGLYEGYVKNFNAMSALLPEYAQDTEHNAHALAELLRRRSFEFGGMRLHELYFTQLEGSPQPLSSQSSLSKALEKDYKSVENFLPFFRLVANTRGPGWAMLYWDPAGECLLSGFSGEQHQGHFATLPIVLALDVWEHTYILDYGAGGRGKYLDAFFKNLNWSVVEKRFAEITA